MGDPNTSMCLSFVLLRASVPRSSSRKCLWTWMKAYGRSTSSLFASWQWRMREGTSPGRFNCKRIELSLLLPRGPPRLTWLCAHVASWRSHSNLSEWALPLSPLKRKGIAVSRTHSYSWRKEDLNYSRACAFHPYAKFCPLSSYNIFFQLDLIWLTISLQQIHRLKS